MAHHVLSIQLIDLEPAGYRESREKPLLQGRDITLLDINKEWKNFKMKADIFIRRLEEHYSFFQDEPSFIPVIDEDERDVSYDLVGEANFHGTSTLKEWRSYVDRCLMEKEYQNFPEALVYENFSFDQYRRRNIIDERYLNALKKYQRIIIGTSLVGKEIITETIVEEKYN